MLKLLKYFVRDYSPSFVGISCFYLTAVVLILLMQAVLSDAAPRIIMLHSVCLLLNLSALIMIKRAEKGKDE